MEKIIAVTMAALVSAVIWYLKHQAKAETEREKKRDVQQVKREEKHDKQQDEDKKFHRDLITNDLKSLHDSSIENAKLNNQSLHLQKEMIKQITEHNGQSKKAWDKTNESLSAICDKLNDRNLKKVKKKDGQK